MNWLGWCWAIAIGTFFMGVGLVFISGPTQTEKREHAGCAIAVLGFLLMFLMLFPTIAVDPGY